MSSTTFRIQTKQKVSTILFGLIHLVHYLSFPLENKNRPKHSLLIMRSGHGNIITDEKNFQEILKTKGPWALRSPEPVKLGAPAIQYKIHLSLGHFELALGSGTPFEQLARIIPAKFG